MAFRDLVAACAVTRARSLSFVYPNRVGLSYSNYFWLHPWMQNDAIDRLTASTPALSAFHVVEQFHGQSSPELSEMELDEIDEPLFKEMMRRWTLHYLGAHQRWQDRALFRSLNMAFQASQIPAGVGTTMYDLHSGCPLLKFWRIRASKSRGFSKSICFSVKFRILIPNLAIGNTSPTMLAESRSRDGHFRVGCMGRCIVRETNSFTASRSTTRHLGLKA